MKKRLLIFKNLIIGFCILSLLTASTFFIQAQADNEEMSFHAIYVGSGDALVISSQGHYMIVDSGPPSSSSSVMNYLEKLNIPDNKIDYVVATHPDGDHVGNFNKILDKYDIGQVIYSPCTKSNTIYTDFINSVKAKGCPYRNPVEGESWKLGDATVEVVYDGSQGSTYNECSIVLRVSCGGKSILLTGDLPSNMESLLISKGYDFKADVIKIGHHGAGSSSSAAFLNKVGAKYAIISSLRSAKAEFPRDSVLKKLARRFVKVYRTSDANVVIKFKNGNITTSNKENNKFISIKNGTISLSNNVFYATGKAITPTVSLIVNGQVVPSYQYKVKYSSNKATGFGKVKLTGTESKYVSTCSTTFMILPKKETITGTAGATNKIKLEWSIQKYSTGYQIRYTTQKGFKNNVQYITITNPNKTKKTLSNLSFNKKYYISIRAYKSNIGNGKWSKTLTVKTNKKPIPGKQEINDFIDKKKSVTIKWTKQSKKYDAGYIIQYSKDKNFEKKVTEVVFDKTSSNKLKLKKTKQKKPYYIRVKGYNSYGEGKWSKSLKFSILKD